MSKPVQEGDVRQDGRFRRANFPYLPQEILCHIALYFLAEGGNRQILQQTASAMRSAVNGLRNIWSSICIRDPQDRIQTIVPNGFVDCQHREYLRLVLQRASPVRVRLLIGSPAMLYAWIDDIMPYSSIITGLDIRWSIIHDVWPLSMPPHLTFSSLNMLSLHISRLVPYRCILPILDAVHRSNTNSLSLTVVGSLSQCCQVLDHPIASHANELSISAADIRARMSRDHRVTLPRLISLTIRGDISILPRLDTPLLQAVEIMPCGKRLDIENVPPTVDFLHLQNAQLARRKQDEEPRRLDKLTEASIDPSSIYQRLADWFECPRLSRLTLFYGYDGVDIGSCSTLASKLHNLLLDRAPFGTLLLEYLCLKGFALSGSIFSTMKQQSHLKTLHIMRCEIGPDFLPEFVGTADAAMLPLPTLNYLCVDSCWYPGERCAYDDFLRECSSRRPRVEVAGARYN